MDPPRAARLMFQLPRSCRTFTVIHPALQWGWSEILTNKMVYLLDVLVWQNTRDSHKKFPRNKPKPFVPDFMGGDISKDTEAHTVDEVRDILAKPRS